MDQTTVKHEGTTVLTTTIGYSGSNTAATTQVASWSNSVGDSYTYTYDDRGNILTVSDGTNTTRYTYDALDQLKREDNQAAGKTWTYTYSNGGNITSKKEYAYTTGTLGTATATKTYTYGDTAWKDLLTAYNGQALTYDTIGNLTNDGTWVYTWEHGRQLAGMSKSGTTISYTYNADGLRSTKQVGSTVYQYYYDPSGQLTDILWGSNKLHFVYDSLGPVAVTYNGTRYYYLRNAQGDITGIMTRNKEQVVSYTYDAWGNVLSVTGTMADTLGAANPLRYRGYLYDSETGLYYLQSRYYNPSWGRFINADRLINNTDVLGANLFAYCSNNPTNKQDSTGNLGVGTIAGAITGALIGGISGAVSAAIKGKSVWAGAATGAVTGALLGVICGSIADSFYTAGASLTVTTVAVGLLKGSVLSGITAFTMNALTQELNYSIDKRNATNNAANGEALPSEFPTWDEYYDMGSALRSGIGAAIFAPLSIGGGYAAGAAAGDTLGDIMGNIIISADISALQSIIELF